MTAIATVVAIGVQVPSVVVLIAEDTVISVETTGGVSLTEPDLEAARSALATGTVMRAGVYPALSSQFDLWPVKTAAAPRAVIGLAFDPDRRPVSPDTMVDVVCTILVLALSRQRSSKGVRPSAEVKR